MDEVREVRCQKECAGMLVSEMTRCTFGLEHFCSVISANAYLQIPTLQAYLGDFADSVPDNSNKVSHTDFFFWFPSAYKSHVYTIL
jgi:hypothetical protein